MVAKMENKRGALWSRSNFASFTGYKMDTIKEP